MDISLLVKAHFGIAIATLLVYIVRGSMMLANSPQTNSRGIHALASILTLLLFGLGFYMGLTQKLSFADGYVLSKIISLLVFVAFGVVALKQGLSKTIASILWLLGLAAFVYAFLLGRDILVPLF